MPSEQSEGATYRQRIADIAFVVLLLAAPFVVITGPEWMGWIVPRIPYPLSALLGMMAAIPVLWLAVTVQKYGYRVVGHE